jgi:lambda repressor-like predicted transcriptional regulator
VELVGAYSNLSEQETRILELMEMAPAGPVRGAPRTNRQVHRSLHDPEIDELVTSYLRGSTVYELAHQHSIHRQTVSEILERREVARRYQKLSPEQLDLAASLYRNGASLTKVGEQLGRRAETMRQALMKAGVEIRSRNGWR